MVSRPGPESLRPLFWPKSVAVLGASNEPSRIGGRPIRYLKEGGFPGPIWPVNTKGGTIQGLPAFKTIDELPEAPECLIVAVPAAVVCDAVESAAKRGTKAAVVFSAGFAEADEQGKKWQDRLVRIAAETGCRIVGPNCLGLFNARHGYAPTFTASLDHGHPKPGVVGMVSQSGAYGSHLFVLTRDRNIGMSCWLTTGNDCDVDVSDTIAYFAQDPDTRVIAAYVEGVKDRDRFMSALEAARRAKKPVVMMKVGSSAVGAAAAMSHTASLAGSDVVYDAALKQLGVHRAETTEEMLDVVYAATRGIFPDSNRLGIVTISGGAGVLMADAAERHGLDVAPMPEAAQARLKAILPFAAVRNPVDTTAQFFNDMSLVTEFTRTILAEGGYGAIAAFVTAIPRNRETGGRLKDALMKATADYRDRLLILCMLASPEMTKEYEEAGYLCFEDPSRAVAAYAALSRFGRSFAKGAGSPPPALPADARPVPWGVVDESEAKALLDSAGVPVAAERLAKTADDAVRMAGGFGYPVVLKIASADIQHKTEIGGVKLNLADAEAVRAAFAEIIDRAKKERPQAILDGCLVAPMIKGGVETILGVIDDASFGPVVMFGLGGIFAEVLKDVTFRVAPFGIDEARAMIREVKGFPLLDGARGRPKLDHEAVAKALAALSVYAAANASKIRSIDVNPFIVLEKGAVAVDALIETK
ncbi:MAG: acetate--CoA ligase family protein [Alphaproteobacteria bacterium]|nr:acetate--CoA ligase family protein [Alphaproteobacteria bacterium]